MPPFQVTDIEETPNPNAVKFNLDGLITAAQQTTSFFTAEDAEKAGDPLATSLFAINGVVGIMYCNDFITINKAPNVPWSRITKKVQDTLGQTDREPIPSPDS